MLNSCAPGVVVCNIDNGYGAGVFAARVARRAAPREARAPTGARMAIAWFDCRSGASGDMVLGALVDAGAPLEVLQAAVDAVGVEPIELSAQPVQRQGLAATLVRVRAEAAAVVRTWANVRDLLGAGRPRRAGAGAGPRRLRPAGRRRGPGPPRGARSRCTSTRWGRSTPWPTSSARRPAWPRSASPRRSPRRWPLGGGMVRAAHGRAAVPGPAVLALLADVGAPVRGGPVPYELCTPTGAAILASAAGSWGDLPAMAVSAVGVGAGARDVEDAPPNVLRIVLGERAAAGGGFDGGAAVVLETNVDDLDPRLWPAVLARLLEAGASDAWLTPILMKKGRPAHTLHVLAAPELAEVLARVVFAETSTLGLRVASVGKRALARGGLVVEVGGRPVRVKTGLLGGAVVNAQPEWDDVAAAAAVLGRPAKDVLAEAADLARQALADVPGRCRRPSGSSPGCSAWSSSSGSPAAWCAPSWSPAACTAKLAHAVLFGMLAAFRAAARAINEYERRDRFLAWAAPLSIPTTLAVWLLGYLLGYCLLLYSLSDLGPATALREAGSSLFTLGFASSDRAQLTALDYLAAATGLVVVALLIGYLPTLYGAYNRRETDVTLLDSRAGEPAWGPEILARARLGRTMDAVAGFYSQWERWAADVSESHSNYPVLIRIRSPRSYRNWLVALVAVLDSAALRLALAPSMPQATGPARAADGVQLPARARRRPRRSRHRTRPRPRQPDAADVRRLPWRLQRLRRSAFVIERSARAGLAALSRMADQLRVERLRARPRPRRRARPVDRAAPRGPAHP